ncbi:MAG: hypothetical protein ABIQ16_06640 [Polyangiaceae bacterium]
MSGHGQHDDHAADHAVHDDHHDGGTSDDFPADEPRSPGWLPLLGGALLLAGIFGYMAFGSDEKSPVDSPEAAPAPAAAQPAALAQPGSARRPTFAMPPGAAVPPNRPRPPGP